MNGNLFIDFIDNPSNGDNIQYVIKKNGDNLVYPFDDSAIVNKTFVTGDDIIIKQSYLAKCDSGFSFDDFTSGATMFNNYVNDVCESADGVHIYATGLFSQYRTQAKYGIVKINKFNGLIATGFTASLSINVFGQTPYEGQRIVEQPDGKIIVAGRFLSGTNPYTYRNIIRFNTNGTIDTTFQQGSGLQNTNGQVNITQLKIVNNTIYVSGLFNLYYTTQCSNLLLLNMNGTVKSNFLYQGVSFNNQINDFVVLPNDNYRIVCVGKFTVVNGTSRVAIALLNGDGGLTITPFLNVNNMFPTYLLVPHFVPEEVTSVITDQNNNLYFTSIGNMYSNGTLFYATCYLTKAFYATQTVNSSSKIPLLTQNNAISLSSGYMKAQRNGDIINIYGNFSELFSSPRQNIGSFRWLPGSNQPTVEQLLPTDSATSGPVLNIVGSGDTLFLCGQFAYVTEIISGETVSNVLIGADAEATAFNTFNNLNNYNNHPNLNYSLVPNEPTKINVEFVGTVTDTLEYTDIVEVDSKVLLYYNFTSTGQIDILNRPQDIMAAYSPIIFEFKSINVNRKNFRYNFEIVNMDDNSTIAFSKLPPELDGTGKIDISKLLSSSLSYDFKPNQTYNNYAGNSFIKYKINIGEEYLAEWSFDRIVQNTGSTINYTILEQQDPTTAHSFIIGDQITISNFNDDYNGLYSILSIPNSTSIVINKVWPYIEFNELNITGTTPTVVYSDNRNILFEGVTSLNNLYAFNGAISWKDFNFFVGDNYLLDLDSTITTNKYFLSTIPRQNFYVKPDQDIILNYFVSEPNSGNQDINLKVVTSDGQTIDNPYSANTSNSPIIQQFNLNPSNFLFEHNFDWMEYTLWNDTNKISETIRLYINHTCNSDKSKDYQVLFKDRFGSFGSFAFDGISKITGEINRNNYKQHLNVTTNSTSNNYNTIDAGTTVTNVEFSEQYELSTGWMTDEMSTYFTELLSSPTVFLKINNIYYSATIEDKSYEQLSQKNKNLIKKTVIVKLANQDPINI